MGSSYDYRYRELDHICVWLSGLQNAYTADIWTPASKTVSQILPGVVCNLLPRHRSHADTLLSTAPRLLSAYAVQVLTVSLAAALLTFTSVKGQRVNAQLWTLLIALACNLANMLVVGKKSGEHLMCALLLLCGRCVLGVCVERLP